MIYYDHNIKVYYRDVDQMGIVYNTRYLEYFEESRTEFMSYWLDTRKSGMLANDLKDVAYCQTPEVLMFLK